MCQVGPGPGSTAATSGNRLELLKGLKGLVDTFASARQRLGPPAASIRSRAQLLQELDVSASAWQRLEDLQDLRETAAWHHAELVPLPMVPLPMVPLPTDVSNKQEENTGHSSGTGSFTF